ncbi:MAG: DUF4124 domain-containing protein [Desulfobacterales bacterium]
MKQGKWIILLILVLFSVPASAEFYKFIDEEGNVQFTDDLTKVPLNQREGVRKYIESRTDAEDIKDNANIDKKEKQLLDGQEKAMQIEDTNLFKIKKWLDAKKKELDSEYEALLKEKEEIDKNIQNLKTNEETKASNKKVQKFNEKIKKYEEKRKAFNTEVKAYNNKVAKKKIIIIE